MTAVDMRTCMDGYIHTFVYVYIYVCMYVCLDIHVGLSWTVPGPAKKRGIVDFFRAAWFSTFLRRQGKEKKAVQPRLREGKRSEERKSTERERVATCLMARAD